MLDRKLFVDGARFIRVQPPVAIHICFTSKLFYALADKKPILYFFISERRW